ncbi:MAG: hypothetical protein A3I72_10295 [Candidatus Tectomicrobia bacterium RIFCSPLOWO2_02_FULL_70_19]|nr:MAG: hypothetical protein A3I72_10295 [Candidatus Tectomicrobia bacterium RIFCSPLOWO2_02_FULL_70_19]
MASSGSAVVVSITSRGSFRAARKPSGPPAQARAIFEFGTERKTTPAASATSRGEAAMTPPIRLNLARAEGEGSVPATGWPSASRLPEKARPMRPRPIIPIVPRFPREDFAMTLSRGIIKPPARAPP